MKIALSAALALTALTISGVAKADDRSVTIYTGAASITLPTSALAPTTQPQQQVAAVEAVPSRKIRVVLASPYRATN